MLVTRSLKNGVAEFKSLLGFGVVNANTTKGEDTELMPVRNPTTCARDQNVAVSSVLTAMQKVIDETRKL
jgi:hypothetical protein